MTFTKCKSEYRKNADFSFVLDETDCNLSDDILSEGCIGRGEVRESVGCENMAHSPLSLKAATPEAKRTVVLAKADSDPVTRTKSYDKAGDDKQNYFFSVDKNGQLLVPEVSKTSSAPHTCVKQPKVGVKQEINLLLGELVKRRSVQKELEQVRLIKEARKLQKSKEEFITVKDILQVQQPF